MTVSELPSRAATAALSPPWDRRRVALTALSVVAVVATALSLHSVRFSPIEFVRGLAESGYFGRAFPPVWEDLGSSLRELWRTFVMAAAGTALAAVMAVPVGLLAARNISPWGWTAWLGRTIITACRAVPDFVFAIFFVTALSIGELPGVLALGFHSIGMLGKLLADAIEEIDAGPLEAAAGAGGGRVQVIANAVAPQVRASYLSSVLYRLDINVRTSVVLGFVGAGGIGFALKANLRNPLRYPVGIGQAILVLVLILVVDQLSAAIRRILYGLETTKSQDRESLAAGAPTRPRRTTLRPPLTRERLVIGFFWGVVVLGGAAALLEVGLTPVSFVRALWRSGKALHFFLPPDFTSHRSALLTGMRETIAIAIAATAAGVLVAVPLAFLVARTTAPNRFVASVMRLVQVLLRAIPELVLVLLFVSAVGLEPIAGAMALAIGTVGFVSKLVADSLESVPAGAQEAVRSSGAGQLQEVTAAALPQALPSIVGHSLYAFDVNVRTSAILGIVGAGGIGKVLDETSALLQYETVGAIIVLIFVCVLVIEQISVRVRRLLL